MQKKGFVSILLACLSMSLFSLLVACGGNKTETTAPPKSDKPTNQQQNTSAPASNTATIKMAYPSTPDFTDVTSLLIWDNPPQGLKVNYEFLAKADIAIQGVMQGDFDIGAAPAITVLKAIDSGMPLKIFAEQMKNEFGMLSSNSITKPEDLQGKRIAIHGPNTLTDALVRATIKKYNLDKAKVLTIPGSDVRTQALLKGEIDATPAEEADIVDVEKNQGDKYHTLISYSKDYPLVNGTVFFTTDKYLNANYDKVKLFTKAILEGYRKVYQNPDFLKQNAAKHMKNVNQKMIDQLTDVYLGNKILDVNGGITKESGEFTINFNKETGLIEGKNLTFEKAYNTKVLDDVLKEIGKK